VPHCLLRGEPLSGVPFHHPFEEIETILGDASCHVPTDEKRKRGGGEGE
tara:strand:- start:205 stop:351 length:147 start_codon:yes stop_codon:yes gene_type:complete